MYLAIIPKNISSNDEISFLFLNNRIDYMKKIIKDINNLTICPTNKSTQYSPYKSPIQTAVDNIDSRRY